MKTGQLPSSVDVCAYMRKRVQSAQDQRTERGMSSGPHLIIFVFYLQCGTATKNPDFSQAPVGF
jgi:hypothetical protein